MSADIHDDVPDTNPLGDPTTPEKWEAIEIWSFLLKGGYQKDFTIRTERNEQAIIYKNAIDQTPVEVMLVFREGDKNEVAGSLRINLANTLMWGKEESRQRVYEKGESPLEKELKRLAEKQQERANFFERKQAEREAAFEAEMADIERSTK